jgi:hypothetical protein
MIYGLIAVRGEVFHVPTQVSHKTHVSESSGGRVLLRYGLPLGLCSRQRMYGT